MGSARLSSCEAVRSRATFCEAVRNYKREELELDKSRKDGSVVAHCYVKVFLTSRRTFCIFGYSRCAHTQREKLDASE